MNASRIPFSLVFAALAMMLAGCRQSQPAYPDHPRSFPGVTMSDVHFFSPALGRNIPYRAYVPTKRASYQKLPVVYLLHGCGGSYQNWSNYYDTGSFARHGLILVMPEGACSYFVNAAFKPEDKYEDFLVHDLIADVESRFPAATGRENRAVVGVSMGGFAAVKLALTRPDLFAFAGAISPAIDVPSRRFSWRRWQQEMRFRTIFGPGGSQTRINSDPFLLVKSADPDKTPYLYITAGEQEPLLGPIRRFSVLLKQRGFAYEFHTRPGAHDWNQWDAQIPGCFDSLLGRMTQPLIPDP
jgi:putative tributyrin esterase